MGKQEVYQYIKDGDDFYNYNIDAEIERNRKGNFELIIMDAEGRKLECEAIDVKMTAVDFNFGANIFMLGEYDDADKNKLYEERFCKIFNSATLPLYWEGTEPQKGYLRYDRDSKRDVYRRPPLDYVVDFCMKKQLRMKGHPLFWHEFVPQWLPDDFSALKPEIVRRFEEIASRYASVAESFDVVNEPSRVYDVCMRDRRSNNKSIVPDDDYCLWLFNLARQYFPANKLIINDTVGASFHEFRGKYSGFYLNTKDLLQRGACIDEIGMQCHLGSIGGQNVYNAERLYHVLDTYASLGKSINISEISIPSDFGNGEDEDLQALATERLYKTCFSHSSMTGITWWNLPDDGVLTKKRLAGDENLPSTGLINSNYSEKKAYKVIDRLVNQEWTTNERIIPQNGIAKFKGFYGKYQASASVNGERKTFDIDLNKNTLGICKLFYQGPQKHP